MRWFRLRRRESAEPKQIAKTYKSPKVSGENLTPNMRALRLAMTVGDVLLGMGVPASRVVIRCLDITESYCKLPVHVDVNANLIMLSQIRGVDKEPLTLIRPVVERGVNNMTIQQVQQLVHKIRDKDLSLEDAEIELENILKNPITYPSWVVTAGNASIAAGVTLMFTSSWRVVLVTFLIAVMVLRVLAFLQAHGISSFFRIIAAATSVTLAAAVIRQLNDMGVEFFQGMNPTLIVVGGIIMLVAGLMIVGAIWDAIEEYYVTANARIMRVVMQTMGIVIGILIGLYVARKIGIGIAVSPDPLGLNTVQFHLAGGAVAAAAYAVGTQTRLRAIVWAGLMGALALAVMYAARNYGVSVVAASGVSAAVVGLIATSFSRRWQTPSVGIVAAGILPLVPGLALYNALMQLVNYPPGDQFFYRGLGTLFTAVATALAIAVGASFGSMIARPLHQRLVYIRNVQPFLAFMRIQLKSGQRSKLANFALSRTFDKLWTQYQDDTAEYKKNQKED